MQRIRYVSFPLPPPFFPFTLFPFFLFSFLSYFFFLCCFFPFLYFFFSPFLFLLFYSFFFFSSLLLFIFFFVSLSSFFLLFFFFFFSSLPLFHWSHRGATLQRHTSKLQGWSWQEIYKIQQRQVCKILPWENLSTWSGLVASPRGLDKTQRLGPMPAGMIFCTHDKTLLWDTVITRIFGLVLHI